MASWIKQLFPVVTDTLAILAEIAVDCAKTSAMALVKERFVTPMCKRLDLELLRTFVNGR